MQTKNNLLRLLVALLTLLPLSVAAQESVKLAEWNMENSADIAVTWFKDGAPQIAPDEAIGDKANYLLTGWSEGRYWQLCTGYQNKVLRIENAAENAITGICGAIVQAQQTPVKTRLDDESLKQLHDSHTQWLGQEKQTLDDHHRQQEESWQKHSQRLTNIVKNNEGIWISTKLFYIAGSLSLLSIMTLAIEISFYVYFHWIQ